MDNRQVNTKGHFAEQNMSKPDILDEIISQLDTEEIPAEFILLAKVRTVLGEELIINGSDLEQMMEDKPDQIADVRVILDVKKIRQAIVTKTNEILNGARLPKP
jgi:hypothetical protein